MAPQGKLLFFFALSIFSVEVFSQRAYDYLWLVQQWPPAVCVGRTCTKPDLKMFTIHGLWPQNYSYPSPLNCPGPQYDRNRITGDLKADLDTYWPDVIDGQNDRFWGGEWNKHGTCSYEVVGDQVAYFRTSVQKRKQYDLLAFLDAAKIKPSGTTWALSSIRSAIRDKTGKRPGIRCDLSTRKRLTEIVLCYNKEGTELIDCTKDRCDANIKW